MNLHHLLLKPLITEKSSREVKSGNKYTFAVTLHANKVQIKQAVETIFKVTVVKVNTITSPAKSRRYKKAIVQLKPTDKIDLFETKDSK